MKKILLFIFTIMSFIVFKPYAHALGDACTDEEKQRLRELVGATKITYEYYEEPDPIIGDMFRGYKVSIGNFKPDFYVYDEKKSTYFPTTDDSVATTDLFLGGITYDLPFYASKGTACEGYLITTKYVKMPYYNPHWNDPLCKGYESYILCKKFTSIVVDSQTEFEQRMKSYIKSLKNKDTQEPTKELPVKISTFDKVIDLIVDNYICFLIAIIVIGTVFIVIIEVKKRRSIL